MKIDKDTIVTLGEIELCLGIKKSQVAELERKDVLKKIGRNQYVLIDCLAGYRDFLRKGSAPDEHGNVVDFNVERARKTKAEADKIERENAIAVGKFMPIDEVKNDISEAVGICAKILGNLKLQIARIAPEIPNRALDLIEKEQAKMLTAVIELDESYQCREVADFSLAKSD